MRVGYACVHTQLPSPARTLRLANASPDRLREVIVANLDAQEEIFRWNIANDIEVFRVTSNLVPFASHPVNTLAWWEEYEERFAELSELVAEGEMRLSMHPGQYTVLSSARPEVVDAAIGELAYHDRVLMLLGVGPAHKIVLHVGSGSASPDAADRFADAVERLTPSTRSRLVLENDERWPIADVLVLARRCELPVVLDVFHHELAPSFAGIATRELVLLAAESWEAEDGRQEIHFSTQAPGKRPGAHSESLDDEAFARFASEVADLPLDCILEVKDKQRSVLRARELLDASLDSSP